MEAQTALIEEASPPSDTTQQDAGDLGSAPTTSAHEDTSSAHDAGRKSPRAGDSLRRSGVGSGLVASVMGIDTERTNPLSPAEAAALGDRLPEPPYTRYIVIARATVRQAPEDESKKLGEFQAGEIIRCCEPVAGRVQAVDAPQPTSKRERKDPPRTGGWLKLVTAKGKELLELVDDETIARSLHEQPVRLGPTKENQGRDHVGTVAANTLVRVHERTDDEGVERIRVWCRSKEGRLVDGWVRSSDKRGELLNFSPFGTGDSVAGKGGGVEEGTPPAVTEDVPAASTEVSAEPQVEVAPEPEPEATTKAKLASDE